MLRKVLVVAGFVILGHLLLTQSVEARSDYVLNYSCSRDAADAEDWIERGRASVTDSPVFGDGIRLTALAGEEGGEFEPGLASAIYRFVVPDWAHYVKIRVHYEDASKDDEVAGRLWIKTVDNEAKTEIDPEEGVPFYGDTFVLRSDRASETIHVPSKRHVEDSRLEMHIVAEGKDCLDVKYIRVEYLEEKPARITVVHHFCDDYWYRWPRHRYVYHYYYWGRCYWPRASLVYEFRDWPCGFYWSVWRPWFRLYVQVHCCYPWWGPRRYTVVYHGDPDDPPARKRALFRKRLKERHVWVGKKSRSQLLVRETLKTSSHTRTARSQEVRLYKQIRTSKRLAAKRGLDAIHSQLKGQPARVEKRQERRGVKPHTIGRDYHESRRLLRPKSRSVISSYAPKEHIRKQSQGQLRAQTAPQISRPKLENRENSRILAVKTRGTKLKSQIWGQPEIRRKSSSRTHGTTRTPPVRSGNLALGRARR
ncbi:MAG: hypothetical protein JSW12_00400 [Deltaproteobacteria bacterium]|nr:MAG: hypothetical protein JSW12_00400 [Deltaproteobacteria bacterium]